MRINVTDASYVLVASHFNFCLVHKIHTSGYGWICTDSHRHYLSPMVAQEPCRAWFGGRPERQANARSAQKGPAKENIMIFTGGMPAEVTRG